LTFSGSWNRQDPATAMTTELPAHSGERSFGYGGMQGRHSSYPPFGVLSETSVGVNRSWMGGDPFVQLPSGAVRVNSTFTDGTPGVQTVSFGGNPTMNVNNSTTSSQLMNALSWFSENNKHKLKLTTELRRDDF